METFNGTLTDSNRIDMHLWRTLYFQLQTSWSRTGSNPLPTIITTNTTIRQNVADTLPTPIPILIGQFNTVKSNAFTSNLLSYNSGTRQVSDVSGRSQSPYDTRNLFAACANKKQSLTGSESFIIKSNLIWNNTTKTISQIQIDFANGQGFQSITIGTPFSVSYTDTGYKRWTIKATLSDNSVLQCYNDYYVLKASGVACRFSGDETVVPPGWGDVYVNSGATIHINYSKRSYTGTLRKPLIVVEGYDVSHIAPDLQDNYRSRDFIDAITLEPVGYDFNGQLDDQAGYDLIFIDFTDGAADIVANAAIVQEVINRVNAHKVNDDRFGNIRQQDVVMGLSMGGLCARYALANMTKNFPGTPTETRLLITHDSPHRGANVPLSLQYLIRMAGSVQLFSYNVYDIYPDYDEAIGLLGAPATQELLYYTATTANTYVANTFLDAIYRPMITFSPSGPQPSYRFIATSLGSECAHPLLSPYSQLLNVNIDGFLFYFPLVSYRIHTIAESYALPATGSTSKIARLKLSSKFKLFGLITVSKDYYDNTSYASGTQLAIDGVPGSTSPLATDFNLPTLNFWFPIPGIFGFLGYVSVHTSGTPGNFTFVPTASALDATPYTTPIFSQKYVNGVNQNYPSTSETFIAQETNTSAGTTNNVHIRFTARNSRWLFNEMESLPNLENCSSECSNPYYIEGASALCSSGNYSIPGLQRGATVVWSASPSGIVTINSPNSTQTTLTKLYNGSFTLTAIITNSCNATPSALTKSIYVGVPTIYGTYTDHNGQHPMQYWTGSPSSYNSVCNSYDAQTNMAIQGVTNVTWSKVTSNPTSISWNQSGYNIGFYFWLVNQTAVFKIDASNNCGTTTNTFAFKSVDCSGGGGGCDIYQLSPNPASSSIQVGINPNIPAPCGPSPVSQPTEQQKTTSLSKTGSTINRSIQSITIYDNKGALQQQHQYSAANKTATLNVSSLPAGIYIVRITDGAYTENHKVVVGK